MYHYIWSQSLLFETFDIETSSYKEDFEILYFGNYDSRYPSTEERIPLHSNSVYEGRDDDHSSWTTGRNLGLALHERFLYKDKKMSDLAHGWRAYSRESHGGTASALQIEEIQILQKQL